MACRMEMVRLFTIMETNMRANFTKVPRISRLFYHDSEESATKFASRFKDSSMVTENSVSRLSAMYILDTLNKVTTKIRNVLSVPMDFPAIL